MTSRDAWPPIISLKTIEPETFDFYDLCYKNAEPKNGAIIALTVTSKRREMVNIPALF